MHSIFTLVYLEGDWRLRTKRRRKEKHSMGMHCIALALTTGIQGCITNSYTLLIKSIFVRTVSCMVEVRGLEIGGGGMLEG